MYHEQHQTCMQWWKQCPAKKTKDKNDIFKRYHLTISKNVQWLRESYQRSENYWKTVCNAVQSDKELKIELTFTMPAIRDRNERLTTCIALFYAGERVCTQFAFGYQLDEGKQQCASRIYATWMANTVSANPNDWPNSD